MIEENNSVTKENWYPKTKEFWQNSEATLSGILEGNELIQNSDVKTSCELLEGLILTTKLIPGSVIDCGAGIGRVTSSVLTKYFKTIDIVEQDEKFCDKCRETFEGNSSVRNIFCSSLQEFTFKSKEQEDLKYDAIWIQWCLENLDDQDTKNFLIKCRNALNQKGLIIIKENITSKGTLFMKHDYSLVRSDTKFKEIFSEAGLKIMKHFHHPNWPKDFMKVSVFVLTDKKVDKISK